MEGNHAAAMPSKFTNMLSEGLCYLEYFGIWVEPMFTFYFKTACPQTPDTYTDIYKYRKNINNYKAFQIKPDFKM